MPGCRLCGVSKSVKRGSVGTALCDVLGVALPPQFKAAIQAVHLGKALVRQVGRRALTGIAVVADHHQRRVEIGSGDEVGQRVVVQVARAADVAAGEALRL